MRKIHKVWGVFTALLVLTGLALCFLGLSRGTLFVKLDRGPDRVTAVFFEELSSGEIEEAYRQLSNYKTLGLENIPRTEDGALLLSALRENYRCTLLGPAEQRGGRAVQPIRLQFLDLDIVEARFLQDDTFDLSQLLSDPEEFTAQEDFLVTLTFNGTEWKILLEPALLDAIQGHAAGKENA